MYFISIYVPVTDYLIFYLFPIISGTLIDLDHIYAFIFWDKSGTKIRSIVKRKMPLRQYLFWAWSGHSLNLKQEKLVLHNWIMFLLSFSLSVLWFFIPNWDIIALFSFGALQHMTLDAIAFHIEETFPSTKTAKIYKRWEEGK